MKFVNFLLEDKATLGVLNSNDEVVVLRDLGIDAKDMNELILNYEKFAPKLLDLQKQKGIKISKDQFLAPIIQPLQDII